MPYLVNCVGQVSGLRSRYYASALRIILLSTILDFTKYNETRAFRTVRLPQKPFGIGQLPLLPAWNLLEASNEPIEYDHNDDDYRDNCFFFPEDCSWSPPKDWVIGEHKSSDAHSGTDDCYDNCGTDKMIPGLPDIKMLDTEALTGLLEDNLSPPEITSILVFATNGAIFAYASPLPARQLRNLSATYGAAYTSYAKNASNGNLTGVNPASHPSSYVTAQSISLGDVGSIVFELDDSVSVVTRIADRVLLATVGPSNSADLDRTANGTPAAATDDAQPPCDGQTQVPEEGEARAPAEPTTNGSTTPSSESPSNEAPPQASQHDPAAALETQYQIDRSADLSRLAGLNLSASPAILLALESKSAALGRFLSQKLEDLESPEDF